MDKATGKSGVDLSEARTPNQVRAGGLSQAGALRRVVQRTVLPGEVLSREREA